MRSLGVVRSPIFIGLVITVVFYVLLPFAPGYDWYLGRLFASHPIAYVTTTLFWMGFVALATRATGLRTEQAGLGVALPAIVERTATEAAARLSAALDRLPLFQRQTYAVRRLDGMARHVTGQGSADGVNGHLEYLAGFEAEQVHHAYGLIRTVTWAVPIMGFLGTVVGITAAIQKLDRKSLDTSLDSVTANLGVAFDTTAQALVLSLVLVFGTYLVEKIERGILAEVEMLALRIATLLFPAGAARTEVASPLLEADSTIAARLLEQSEALVGRQVELWRQALGDMQTRWTDSLGAQQRLLTETLSGQQRLLDESLRQTMQVSVADHARSLEAMRTRLIDGLSETASVWSQSADRWEAQQQRQAEQHQQATVAHQQATIAQQETARLMAVMAGEQRAILDQLLKLQPAESFDQTMHTLSAAVHLLSARTARAA